MTQITDLHEKVRSNLRRKELTDRDAERIKAEMTKVEGRRTSDKMGLSLKIVAASWKPLLRRIDKEVYRSGMFNEINRVWEHLPVEFTYEMGCSYIPVHKLRLNIHPLDLNLSHELYITQKGFNLRLKFDCSNSQNWQGFRKALSTDKLLRMAEWTNPDILNFLERNSYSTCSHNGLVIFETPDPDKLLKYESPFFLYEVVELNNTGKISDILEIPLDKIKEDVKFHCNIAERAYESRVLSLLSAIK